ncbi:YitT family protein [Pontibacillus litoralis]|nr:YitT family protein [Pontibacillus litoralis]
MSKKLMLITIGSFLFAFGINYFAIPNNLSEGGVIGIAIVLYYVFGWSTGLVTYILNIALILIGYKFLDKKTMGYTLYGIAALSFFLWATEGIGNPVVDDSLLAPIYTGVFVGVGLGITFLSGATSGGTQIISKMFNQYFGWSMALSILVIDLLVVGASVFVIGQKKALLTLISIYVGAKAIDYIVDGLHVRKAVTIISTDSETVLNKINQHFTRGVTVFNAKGGYSNQRKDVLYAVVRSQETVKLQKLVAKVDPDAFVVIHDVRSAFGGGFK